MIKKIMELSKINKYDDSVKKESEIDELYAKYIKTRLACIDNWFGCLTVWTIVTDLVYVWIILLCWWGIDMYWCSYDGQY